MVVNLIHVGQYIYARFRGDPSSGTFYDFDKKLHDRIKSYPMEKTVVVICTRCTFSHIHCVWVMREIFYMMYIKDHCPSEVERIGV